MSTETYELLALAARYWFIALAALFVLRGWRASVKDNRNAKILRDWAGGAGCVGELVVLEDGQRSKKKTIRGARFPVPEEGLIGSGSTADIRIRHGDLRSKHVWFAYRKGRLMLTAAGRAKINAPMTPDGRYVLRDGDELSIGKLRFVMVFYDVQDAAQAQPVFVRSREPEETEEETPYEENFWE